MDAGNGERVAGVKFLYGQVREVFFAGKGIPAGKEGTMPVLAPYIEPLDMVTMLMGDY